MRKRRPPEQVSVMRAVSVAPQAQEKPQVKHSGGRNRASRNGDPERLKRDSSVGMGDAKHSCGDMKQPTQSAPGRGKVVLLRRDPPTPAASTSTPTPTKRVLPKKKVEWIPYPQAPSSPVLNPVWVYRQRVKGVQHREPSPAAPVERLAGLSLKEPLLSLDTGSPGAGEGSSVLGLRAASWTQSSTGQNSWKLKSQQSGCPVTEARWEEAETIPDSPGREEGRWYSTAPASSGGMMPFRRKKSTNMQPSVSWADDDYWASWDGWNEVIDWEDTGPTRRKGRKRNREGKKNGHRWANKDKDCQW